MPRALDYSYGLPAGTLATSGTVIESAPYNTVMEDLEAALNGVQPVAYGGTGATTAAAARTALGVLDSDATMAEVATIAALRLLDNNTDVEAVFVRGYGAATAYADGQAHGGGFFWYDPTNVDSDDNWLTIVDASSRRWLRVIVGPMSIAAFGVCGKSGTDDTTAWGRMVTAINAGDIKSVYVDDGFDVQLNNPSNVFTASGWSIVGAGWDASKITMVSGAGTYGTIFQIGSAAASVDSCTIRDLTIAAANASTQDGTKPVIDLYRCDRPILQNLKLGDSTNSVPFALKVGNASYSAGQGTIRTLRIFGYKEYANAIVDILNVTGTTFDDVRMGAGNETAHASCRGFRIRPPVGANIDSLTFIRCLGNFPTGNDMPVAWEIDCSYINDVGNISFINCFGELTTQAAWLLHSDTKGRTATVTITNASPAVVTWTGHGLTPGQKFSLTTTGSLPTGLSPATDYYVNYVDVDTFQLSATSGGASINTSSAGSGVHTGAAAGSIRNVFWTDCRSTLIDSASFVNPSMLIRNTNYAEMTNVQWNNGIISAGRGPAISITGDPAATNCDIRFRGPRISDRSGGAGSSKDACSVGIAGTSIENAVIDVKTRGETIKFDKAVAFIGSVNKARITGNDFSKVRTVPCIDTTAIAATVDPTRIIIENNLEPGLPTLPMQASITGTTSAQVVSTIPMSDEQAILVEVDMVIKRTGTQKRAYYKFAGGFYRDGGAGPVQDGSTSFPVSIESDAAFDAGFSISGNNVRVTATASDINDHVVNFRVTVRSLI